MTPKTSDSHPIDVSWIDHTPPGRVGLTVAPGKHGVGASAGGRWERDLVKDLDRLVHAHGAGLLVCLLEDHELVRLGIPTLVDEARRRMAVLRLPIPDGGVLPDARPVRALVRQLEDAVRAGTHVVIHCRGGLGRAGTIGGCMLKHLGMSDDAVFARLKRRHRTRCPETLGQRDFIRAFGGGR